MDLIYKIEKIIKELNFESPVIDIHYDNQKNIVGYITDESFKLKTDNESQKLIWTALKQNLEKEELLRIIALFHETPQERVKRISGFSNQEIKFSNFWIHETPELARYWLFIDVAKFGEEFKSFFLIINEKRKINKGLTFVYNKEVLDFMELEQQEIHTELYSNTFNNAEAEIKMDLMKLYDDLSNKQLWGKSNLYWYVYESFKLIPVSKSQIILTQGEIELLKKGLVYLDDFGIKNDIEKTIKNSEIMNNMRKEIS